MAPISNPEDHLFGVRRASKTQSAQLSRIQFAKSAAILVSGKTTRFSPLRFSSIKTYRCRPRHSGTKLAKAISGPANRRGREMGAGIYPPRGVVNGF